jgi:hypothetical protein
LVVFDLVTAALLSWRVVLAHGAFLRQHCSLTAGLALVILYALLRIAPINHVEFGAAEMARLFLILSFAQRLSHNAASNENFSGWGPARTVAASLATTLHLSHFMLAPLVRRLYCRALGTFGLQQLSWNLKYETGLWDSPERSPETIRRVTDLCGGGKLVEFGCGKGELPRRLPSGTFSTYVGFDISDLAIAEAQAAATSSGLRNASFHQADMAKWTGNSGIQLILAEECLYYLNPCEQQAFLRKCCQSLSPTGKILVIVHDAIKHARTVITCRTLCHVLEDESIKTRTYLILAPKPDAT